MVLGEVSNKWNRRGSNPGPSAYEADVIPLHHNPMPGKNLCITCLNDVFFHFQKLSKVHLHSIAKVSKLDNIIAQD